MSAFEFQLNCPQFFEDRVYLQVSCHPRQIE
jgi:hypothetical protein